MFICKQIIIYKRPIMCINSQATEQNEIIQSQNHITKLKEMLRLNKNAQMKLLAMKSTIDKRKKQLEELGVLPIPSLFKTDQSEDRMNAFQQVKKIPSILMDQQLIKKNSTIQYGFVKNLTEPKQQKTKKIKQMGSQQIFFQSFPDNVTKINFLQLAKKQKEKSGLDLYKQWKLQKIKNKEIDQRQGKANMNINQQKLLEKRKIYGDNWQKIGYYFNGFTFQNLYYYYQKNLNKVETGKWTLRQNLILIALVEYYGSGKWALISKKLKVKSQFQIRQRFCNVLDPNIKQNKWSEQDEELLLRQAKAHKYKWSKIVKSVKQFQNKTDNALRRKFRNIMIKKQDDQIRRIIRNHKLEESIIKFKKGYYNRRKKGTKRDDDDQEQENLLRENEMEAEDVNN